MTYLLDTDTCIAVLRGNPTTVQHIKSISPDDIAISSITRYELLYGVIRCDPKHQKDERAKVDRLLDYLHEIPFSKETAECAALIRCELESKGEPIGPMDLQIAATAIESELIIVTGNEREFSRIAGLQNENWIR